MFEHDYKNYPELSNSQLETMGLSSPHKQITEDFEAVVVKVHDGDTVTLQAEFRDFLFPLRLLDVDAPEMSEGGAVTRDWLRERLLGEKVKILINPLNRVGKYGRLLGKIFHCGMNVADEMIYLGLVAQFGMKKEGEIPNANKFFALRQWF